MADRAETRRARERAGELADRVCLTHPHEMPDGQASVLTDLILAYDALAVRVTQLEEALRDVRDELRSRANYNGGADIGSWTALCMADQADRALAAAGSGEGADDSPVCSCSHFQKYGRCWHIDELLNELREAGR